MGRNRKDGAAEKPRYHGFVMDDAEFSEFERLYGDRVSAEFARRAIRFACKDRKNFEMIFFPDRGGDE